MLPDIEGFEVCRRLRAEDICTPVLFLTARDATADKLTGLAEGDDYVTKPFSIDELVARIRAVLRRTSADDTLDEVRLGFADLVMDAATHEVWRGDHPIDLTATEFNLLLYLLRNARKVLSKAQILDAVWEDGFDGDSNIVEIYISYLRKKIDCYDPPLIHTIRRVGYCLREPAPMRLRRRLVATMIVLVALGLAAVDLITLTSLHSYLYGRIDDQLTTASGQVARFVVRAEQRGFAVTPATIDSRVSPETSTSSSSIPDGAVTVARPSGTADQQDPRTGPAHHPARAAGPEDRPCPSRTRCTTPTRPRSTSAPRAGGVPSTGCRPPPCPGRRWWWRPRWPR